MSTTGSLIAGPSTQAQPPSILNIHTPTTSFALIHSLTQDSLQTLYDKLSRKHGTEYEGSRVGPGWLKYEWNDGVWSLDDESDYTIFAWRQQQILNDTASLLLSPNPNASSPSSTGPTLHLREPGHPLPEESAYRNPSFYLFRPASTVSDTASSASPRPRSTRSKRTVGSKKGSIIKGQAEGDGVPTFKKEFEKFHSENGVRTVIGTFGHVKDVRMLLKSGYRHVYVSRKFALKHGFIGKDLVPGHGYSGLVGIGKVAISLNPSTPQSSLIGGKAPPLPKVTEMMVYLSEEPHFDIVLGRAFFEKRQIKTDPVDLTDVVCLDTGEKVHCELVILKDGRGEFVTVT